MRNRKPFSACLLSLTVLALALIRPSAAHAAVARLAPPLIVPAGTALSVSVTAALVSNVAKTGDSFTFVTDADVIANGIVIVRKGTVGSGTVAFAGGAGGHGHEGNLHLVFDEIPSTLKAPLLLGIESDFNGHKQRTIGLISGASWLTGFGAAVRGGQAVVVPEQTIELHVASDTCINAAAVGACAAH
jgi:hypothetical protein